MTNSETLKTNVGSAANNTALVSASSSTDLNKADVMDKKHVKEAYEDQPEDLSQAMSTRREEVKEVPLDDKVEGELCLAATVLGCRTNKDRIEFAQIIKEHVIEMKGKEP